MPQAAHVPPPPPACASVKPLLGLPPGDQSTAITRLLLVYCLRFKLLGPIGGLRSIL